MVKVDGHGLKSINGYVNKWGRQTFTAMLMLLFIILLIKRRCSVRYIAWKMYFHGGGSWDDKHNLFQEPHLRLVTVKSQLLNAVLFEV